MRLYVVNRNNQKVIIDITAPTRASLATRTGYQFYVGSKLYTVYDVHAESSSNDTAAGAVLGGLGGWLIHMDKNSYKI